MTHQATPARSSGARCLGRGRCWLVFAVAAVTMTAAFAAPRARVQANGASARYADYLVRFAVRPGAPLPDTMARRFGVGADEISLVLEVSVHAQDNPRETLRATVRAVVAQGDVPRRSVPMQAVTSDGRELHYGTLSIAAPARLEFRLEVLPADAATPFLVEFARDAVSDPATTAPLTGET